MDHEIGNCVEEKSDEIDLQIKILALVSDSPNVMQLTGKCRCGDRNGGSSCVVFVLGCVCHALRNVVKDICSHDIVKLTLVSTVKWAKIY